MIRIILFSIIVVIACILSLPVWLCMWIIHFFNKDLTEKIAFGFIKTLCLCGVKVCGARLDIRGQEYIPEDQPAVYIMNHRSIFDIIIAYTLMKRKTGFIAKKELKKAPFLAQWISLNHGLFMDRSNIREGLKTIMKGIDYINEGFSMVIFPEGTRNKDKESHSSLLPFHGGSFKLAERTGVPIIPVVFWNTEDCFENHKPFLKAAEVKVRIGEPIILDTMEKEQRRQLAQYTQDIMQGMLNDIEKETNV